MALTYDPTTAYRQDWQYVDGVEDVTLVRRLANGEQEAAYPAKLVMGGLLRPDYQAYGQASFSPNTPDGFLWLLPSDSAGNYPPAPKVDDAIVRELSKTELMITSVNAPRIGPYEVSFVEGRRNE